MGGHGRLKVSLQMKESTRQQCITTGFFQWLFWQAHIPYFMVVNVVNA